MGGVLWAFLEAGGAGGTGTALPNSDGQGGWRERIGRQNRKNDWIFGENFDSSKYTAMAFLNPFQYTAKPIFPVASSIRLGCRKKGLCQKEETNDGRREMREAERNAVFAFSWPQKVVKTECPLRVEPPPRAGWRTQLFMLRHQTTRSTR